MESRRVVITGLGAITSVGNNHEAFFNALIAGTSGAAPITLFDASKFKTRFACEVKNYDPSKHFDRKELRKIDRFAQFALLATQEAIETARLDPDSINKERAGVIFGTGNGGISTFEGQLKEFHQGDGTPRFSPFLISRMIPDTAAGLISIKYGFMGVNYAPVSACASSNTAIIDAFNYIKWGKVDTMICGGAEAPITEASVGGFNAMKALSTNNEHPEQACRPFDVNRDGFVVGEGGAALVLEEYEQAKKRNAPIFAEVVGGGMSADAYHITATHPEGAGARLAIQQAIEEAGITPAQVNYVNAHATSTPVGDISEVKGLVNYFGDGIGQVAISATKSMTGHLLGGAGAIEAVATVMSVKHNIVPPTINTTDIDPAIDANAHIVVGQKEERPIQYALSNTFGFGGHNATVLVKKYEG